MNSKRIVVRSGVSLAIASAMACIHGCADAPREYAALPQLVSQTQEQLHIETDRFDSAFIKIGDVRQSRDLLSIDLVIFDPAGDPGRIAMAVWMRVWRKPTAFRARDGAGRECELKCDELKAAPGAFVHYGPPQSTVVQDSRGACILQPIVFAKGRELDEIRRVELLAGYWNSEVIPDLNRKVRVDYSAFVKER